MPALRPKDGDAMDVKCGGIKEDVTGGMAPRGLGGPADVTGTLATGGTGINRAPPPTAAWLQGVGFLEGGSGGEGGVLVGAAAAVVGGIVGIGGT